MSKNNNMVETANNGQATQKKISKVPTGKVKTIKSAEERKKAREEQYRSFRINALKRRCARMKYDEKTTEELVKKLIEQLNSPNEYSILIMLNPKDGPMMKEGLAKNKLKYKYHGDTFIALDGDQAVLEKIREISPPSAKIYQYVKKKPSVIEAKDVEKKAPTKNKPHSRPKGKNVYKKRPNVAGMSKKNRKAFKAQVKSLQSKWKAEKKARTIAMKQKSEIKKAA